MLSIIVAVGENNEIGKDNKLLWHLPNDLKYFKKVTNGGIIIMGRKTFESLPFVLPNRHHIVITNDVNYKINNENVTIVHSIDEIKNYIQDEKEYFVIGGGSIYKLLLQYCGTLYVTKVYKSFDADTFFPEINNKEWDLISFQNGLIDEKNTLTHSFSMYKRIN